MADHALRDSGLDGPSLDGPLLVFLRLIASGAGADAIGAGLAEGLLRDARPHLVSVYLLDADGACLEERVRYGAPPDPDHQRVSVDVPVPMTEVFRTGRAGAWTMSEAAQDFPAVAGWMRSHPAHATDEVFIVPVRAQGRPIGVLLVTLPGPADRSWQLGRLMDAASTALAVWVMSQPPEAALRARPARGIEVSERQGRIVDGVRDGLSNAQIAQALDVSVSTVKADLATLYRLFGVSDREAVAGLVAATRPPAARRR